MLGFGVNLHEAKRLHHAHWRCNGCVAARGARAAASSYFCSYFGLQMVSMNEIDHWLERLYWIAMISVPFLAIWAGRVALRQVQTGLQQVDAALQEAQTVKLFKILQHVEEQIARDARHIALSPKSIVRKKKAKIGGRAMSDCRGRRYNYVLRMITSEASSRLMDLIVWDNISWRGGAKVLFVLTLYWSAS